MCGRQVSAVRRRPVATPCSGRTPRPAASQASRPARITGFRHRPSPGLHWPGAARISMWRMPAPGAPTCSRPAPSCVTPLAPPISPPRLAYGWQDITTDRTVTIAGIDRLRAQFNANAWSGRVEGGYRLVDAVDEWHRHHALCRGPSDRIRPAGLRRKRCFRCRHLCVVVWREDRDGNAQRTWPALGQILCGWRCDPDAARARRLGA